MLRGTLLAALASAALVAVGLANVNDAHAANVCGSREIWINDLDYGTRGGGVYWDPPSSKVWTPERGWHYFAPESPRPNAKPLWVDQLDYGSRGGGYYWDPVSGQVWTAEGGWHVYGVFGCGSRPVDSVSATDELAHPRWAHTATLLKDGRVLVVGGLDDGGSIRASEIYDPRTDEWSSVGQDPGTPTGRAYHTASLLKDGRVLVVGGYDLQTETRSAVLFDPTTGEWATTGDMARPRSDHTATLLQDGRVMVIGGFSQGSRLASIEIYDPSTGSFSPGGETNGPRVTHKAFLLKTGRVLVWGGEDKLLPGGRLLELVNPATTTSSSLVVGLTNVFRSLAAAVALPDGRILISGGSYARNDRAEMVDPVYFMSSEVAAPLVARELHTLTLLLDGRVLAAGGLDLGTSLPTAILEISDPTLDQFVAEPSLTAPRMEHTATQLRDGRVLIVGGASRPFPIGGALASCELLSVVPVVYGEAAR